MSVASMDEMEDMGATQFQESNGDEQSEDSEDEPLMPTDEAFQVAQKAILQIGKANICLEVAFIARGAYNTCWRVDYKTHTDQPDALQPENRTLALRIARRDSPLQPYRVRNEVACLRYLEANLPDLPAPRVYAWNDGTCPDSGPIYIAEEFVDGQRLSVEWPKLTELQKATIIEEIANVLADLGQTRFSMIGGLSIEGGQGPTMDSGKIFDGRPKFHSHDCYNIGPYLTVKEYIEACYDREIYYYENTPWSDLVQEYFEHVSVASHVEQLRLERKELGLHAAILNEIDQEPRVLVHEDFQAANILVKDGHLNSVIDWEWSSVYPISELVGLCAIVQVSPVSEDTRQLIEEEEDRWQDLYISQLSRVLRARRWSDKNIAAVLSSKHSILRKARGYMYPETVEDGPGDGERSLH